MTFPVVEATNSSSEGSNTTSHTVSLPVSIASGELLLVFMGLDGLTSVTFPVGWNELFDQQASGATCASAWREADGGEGSSITVTSADSETSVHASLRISGAEDPDTQPPEFNNEESVGSTTNPDPPNLTPTGGSKDYLWVAFYCGDTGNVTTTAFPYTNNNISLTVGTTGQGVHGGLATDTITAASENPGTFTTNVSRPWIATTMAIHPVAVAPTGIVIFRRRIEGY